MSKNQQSKTTDIVESPTITSEVKSVPVILPKNDYQVLSKNNTYTIKPYLDGKANMGLEKYNMALFEGANQREDLGYVLNNGIPRYITGLDEFSQDIVSTRDPEVKAAKIKTIRQTVSKIEEQMFNIVDPEDVNFWEKVKFLHPIKNPETWKAITLTVSNRDVLLNADEAEDLILISCIRAGGFSSVAKSLEDARVSNRSYKFYLDSPQQDSAYKTEDKKIKNKALALLQTLFDTNADKLWLVAKNVDLESTRYKKDTNNDIVYELMDNFINGKAHEKSVTRAAKDFMAAAEKPLEYLRVKAYVKDASYYKYLETKADGNIYHRQTSTMIGKNIEDCVEYFKSALNSKIFDLVLEEVNKHLN